jgi:hypothetical protein
MSGGGHFVDRGEIAKIITPRPTSSWHPVPHIDVVNMMTHAIEAKNMRITGEQFGLAREGQKLFGVMQINRTSSLNGVDVLASGTRTTRVFRWV